MSKGVKQLVAVATAVAIPFAAPALAASLGASAALGSIAGSALVGAGLGAARGALLGEDIGRSALFGGIGGGVSGYFAGPPGVGGVGGGADGLAAPSAAGAGVTTSAAPGAFTPGTDLYSLSGGVGSTGIGEGALGGGLSTGGTGLASGMGASALGSGLSSGATGAAGLSVPTFAAPTTAAFESAAVTPGISSAGSGFADGTLGSGISVTPSAVNPSFAADGVLGTGISAPSGGSTLSAPSGGTFSDAIRRVPDTLRAKFSDPEVLADLTLRAGGQLLGSAVAGEGLTPEEQALLAAQTDELRRLQQTNEVLFREKLAAAQGLIGESKYFDPEYFGLQSARQAQTAGGIAKRAGLRGLTGDRRAAEERRYDLATARDTGTRYDQGFQSGVSGRLNTIQAGLSAFPSGMNSTSGGYSALANLYNNADQRRRQQQSDIGTLFGDITGGAKSQQRG